MKRKKAAKPPRVVAVSAAAVDPPADVMSLVVAVASRPAMPLPEARFTSILAQIIGQRAELARLLRDLESISPRPLALEAIFEPLSDLQIVTHACELGLVEEAYQHYPNFRPPFSHLPEGVPIR